MATPQEILERLRTVPYPGYSRDIVSFGIVKDIGIGGTGVTFTLTPSTDDAEVLGEIQDRITEVTRSMGLGEPTFEIEKPPARGLAGVRGKEKIPGVARVIAVASGKGGVGKSTVAANLALALHAQGRRVGLLDADVYGPSVPTMLGITEKPRTDEQRRILPPERHGIRAISMGMFLDRSKPILWRGPMVTKTLVEFTRNVVWGELDVLVLDLPPGTGDAQLTICQQVPLDGGVIVTTPQDVALLDVRRGLRMFREADVNVLGIVDNMSFHTCAKCGTRSEPFGHGGSAALAAELGLPVLASLPLVRAVREHADAGRPLVAADPSHPQSLAFLELARRVEERLTASAAPAGATPFHVLPS